MIQQSFQELYSAKSNDELLTLAADISSLREDVKAILVQERERRNLEKPPSQHRVEFQPAGVTPPRALVFVGALLLNTFIACFCTPLLERGIGTIFHSHSFAALLLKWWTLDPIFAAGLGFSVYRLWKTNSVAWTWVLPALWFGLRFIPAVLSADSQSVFSTRSVWSHFSGIDCAEGLQAVGCRQFLLFTLPFVRGVFYALGAYLSMIVSFQAKHIVAAARAESSAPSSAP